MGLGRLKNGNPTGPQFGPDWPGKTCGAKTRKETPCQGIAMKNGRCRMHGGKSTGPKTSAGKDAIRRAHWKHGRYSVFSQEVQKREAARRRIERAEVRRIRRAGKIAMRALDRMDNEFAEPTQINVIYAGDASLRST